MVAPQVLGRIHRRQVSGEQPLGRGQVAAYEGEVSLVVLETPEPFRVALLQRQGAGLRQRTFGGRPVVLASEDGAKRPQALQVVLEVAGSAKEGGRTEQQSPTPGQVPRARPGESLEVVDQYDAGRIGAGREQPAGAGQLTDRGRVVAELQGDGTRPVLSVSSELYKAYKPTEMAALRPRCARLLQLIGAESGQL